MEAQGIEQGNDQAQTPNPKQSANKEAVSLPTPTTKKKKKLLP